MSEGSTTWNGAATMSDSLAEEGLLAAAVQAQGKGEPVAALELYERLESSTDRWYSWAGTSGRTALLRMAGDYDGARAVTASMRAMRPELTGLMYVWDGDTAAIEGDVGKAMEAYRIALDGHAEEAVGELPLGLVALRQMARIQLAAEAPAASAAAYREIVQRYPGWSGAEFALASAVAYDTMADGKLAVQSLAALLHDGVCAEGAPCAFASRGIDRAATATTGVQLAGMNAVQFTLSAEDEALRQMVQHSAPMHVQTNSLQLVNCVVPWALDGFTYPMSNDHTGWDFMKLATYKSGQVYHPGLDINGPGGGDTDCGLQFVSAAKGCVTDSSPANWGSATVQSTYAPGTWTHQYGHASTIYYSSDSAIAKGALLGAVGKVGLDPPASCHLHFEIREPDHPNATDADYWENLASKANVGNWYQHPFPFIDAHRSFGSLTWIDEAQFTFYGSWSPVPDVGVPAVGDENDLKYAATTSSKQHYARYKFIPTSSRVYRIWAFVPWNHATSTAAKIKLYNASNTVIINSKVDQSTRTDAWVYIGSASLNAYAKYFLEVASNTGESGKKVAVDDFLILGECSCADGSAYQGNPINPDDTYCGYTVCGGDYQIYECTGGGWVPNGTSCP